MSSTPEIPPAPWSSTGDEVVRLLASDAELGISTQEAARRRELFGANEIPEPLEDSLLNMRVIDAVRKAGETGQWERP